MEVPPELQTEVNRQVLAYLEGKSSHSDNAELLGKAVEPLGDVQTFCPDWSEYLYVLVATKGVVFGLSDGMRAIAFRLDERMRSRALATGGVASPECGPEWVSFEVFRDDWPKVDSEFWARKAYVYARETKP